MTDGLHGVEADVPTGVCREGRRGDAVAQDAGRRTPAGGGWLRAGQPPLLARAHGPQDARGVTCRVGRIRLPARFPVRLTPACTVLLLRRALWTSSTVPASRRCTVLTPAGTSPESRPRRCHALRPRHLLRVGCHRFHTRRSAMLVGLSQTERHGVHAAGTVAATVLVLPAFVLAARIVIGRPTLLDPCRSGRRAIGRSVYYTLEAAEDHGHITTRTPRG
jgi:hypothetical protein